jgi:phosphate-selective porin
MKKLIILLIPIIVWTSNFNIGYSQGCAEPTSDEGVTIWGYLQPEFATYFEEDKRATFQFRRMRIGAMGNVPYDFSYYVLLEASNYLNPEGSGIFLLDAFVTYNRFDYAKISIGSFKYPFGLELTTGCHKLYTIRRSKIVNEMAISYDGTSNRDLGIMVLGGTKNSLISYQVALTNGYGIFNTDGNLYDSYSLTGRFTAQPISGLRFGASTKYGALPPESTDAEITDDDTKFRYGFDVSFQKGNYMIQAEYINGEDKGSYTNGGGCDGGVAETVIGTKFTDGFYAMGAYRFTNNLEPVYKIETFSSSKSSSSVPAGPSDESSSLCHTFGLNYYPNDWTRLQLNYVYAAEDPEEIKNDALLLQLQIKF